MASADAGWPLGGTDPVAEFPPSCGSPVGDFDGDPPAMQDTAGDPNGGD